jgi:dienelactone hydrolase
MIPSTFDKERTLSRAFSEYEQGDYEQACKVIESLASPHRERGESAYLHLSLLSLLGRSTEALELLERMVRRGAWLDPALLRTDSDLQFLHSSPRFQRVCEAHARLQGSLAQKTNGTRIVYPEGEGPYPLLLVLHGNQQNAEETLEYWRTSVKAGWMVVALESQQAGCGRGCYVWNDYRRAREQVVGFLREHANEWNGTLVLGGFSRGARTAITLSLDGTVRTAGVMAVCPGALEDIPALTVDVAAVPMRATIFLGGQDPYARGSDELERCLTATGSEVTYRVIDGMEHSYPKGFPDCLAEMMRKIG